MGNESREELDALAVESIALRGTWWRRGQREGPSYPGAVAGSDLGILILKRLKPALGQGWGVRRWLVRRLQKAAVVGSTTYLEMPMRKLDTFVLRSLLGLAVVSAIACSDESKPTVSRDGSVDRPTDTLAPDSNKLDVAASDGASADAVAVDAPSADVIAPLDQAGSLDAGGGDGVIDVAGVDGGLGPDSARIDGAAALDGGSGEAGPVIDGAHAVDGGVTTMANITFRLDNRAAATVYLRNACWFPFTVTSLADGSQYANASYCACDCADSRCDSAVACAPCAPPSGVAVAAGESKDIAWTARKSTLESRTGEFGAFQCVSHQPIAVGTYRVAVPVYATQEDAEAELNARTVEQSFVLDTSNAVVVVPIPGT